MHFYYFCCRKAHSSGLCARRTDGFFILFCITTFQYYFQHCIFKVCKNVGTFCVKAKSIRSYTILNYSLITAQDNWLRQSSAAMQWDNWAFLNSFTFLTIFSFDLFLYWLVAKLLSIRHRNALMRNHRTIKEIPTKKKFRMLQLRIKIKFFTKEKTFAYRRISILLSALKAPIFTYK